MLVEDTRGVVAPLRGGAGRTQADIEAIREGLQERYDELQAEYEHAVIETQQLSRAHLADTAGDLVGVERTVGRGLPARRIPAHPTRSRGRPNPRSPV